MRTKLKSSTISKFFSLLLIMLMIAFVVSITDSPLAEVNEADSSENDLEQGQYDLEIEHVSLVILAEGNQYSDSSERDLDQGHLTASYLQLELAETTMSFDSVLESVNHINTESLSSVKDDFASEDAQPLKMLQRSPIDRNGGNVGAFHILGISSSSLVLGLLAATVLQLYLKRRCDKIILHPVDEVSKHNVVKEKEYSSQNWPTEVDVSGEYSCTSEMSCSFQMSSTYKEKYPESVNDDEAQSIEKKPRKSNRRESLAASDEYSMGSPSYGSITTYERVPSKHASGTENAIIPVRRSSRIRSHVPSSTFRF
ncbi:uncharacterized protein LOC107759278 [Nicotiana tabacum]|uniref:Uncharacterized protein n=2 Tax=Nicotiana TaxID=4085 RepID=A0A1S3WYE2_TOBAC|nr:PREDICTED: uncharacterized protein LOC104228859 [Nicotiana sylvestris]XP_009779789.1 PREDICTED: uncharacterized protein LOC104228859 [Nicotiana sylvestris]XP_009779844.1 PREDICTED: uncharacterized protein LOC104228859 [Nicotiana sylvestris]XP_009779905.1 PREDICTED: uncharacterized protein LOC104228859 [Nicotiana sylvestris]XP_016432647.1 PREDICTED: uncharacterized protein LOC107759278 [Nicotiana tabacum]XP_016432648.1 PREDICTED: uncharacterized protein LOC107759278 [Nicotiana tabacum]XP_01